MKSPNQRKDQFTGQHTLSIASTHSQTVPKFEMVNGAKSALLLFLSNHHSLTNQKVLLTAKTELARLMTASVGWRTVKLRNVHVY